MSDPHDFDLPERLGRVEMLLARLEEQPDPALREGARELLATVLELHAAGLRRLLELASARQDLAAVVAREPVLAGLLALHDLHPVPLRARVERALADIALKLEQGGTRAELVSLEGGAVHVELVGKVAFRDVVLRALEAVAPDASSLSVSVAPELVPLRLGRAHGAEAK